MICVARDTYQCSPTECVLWSKVCDGIAHCSNKADENCDMCINDLYTCKDSSKINCTLACNTLGYIPCRNYMDKNICSSINQKSNKFVNSKSIKSNYFQFISSTSQKEVTLLSDSTLYTILGLIIFGSFILFFILLSIRLKQKRKLKYPMRSRDIILNQNDNNQITDSTLLDNININQSGYELNLDKKSLNQFNNNKKKPQLNDNDHMSTKSNDELKLSDKLNSNVNIYSTLNHQRLKPSENSDYQLYGEPPPSYQQSKYYPITKTFDITTTESHIYENIDESNLIIGKKHKGNFKILKDRSNVNKTSNKNQKQRISSEQQANNYSE